MSWLKSTISKVREKGQALKESEALKSLQEKTTNAVASAASQVRNASDAFKAGRVNTVLELEAQLEQAARGTKKIAALADLHRFWAQQAALKDKDAQAYRRAEENERPLGFREVLLRSRALELTIETIASDAALRGSYSESPTPEDKSSPAACLHLLLSRTLSVPATLWSEVLRLATGSDGLGDGHVVWLVEAVSAMKIDWREEVYVAERKEMALRAEYLRQEIKQLEGQQVADESDERYRRRVSASLELLQTYQAVRRNLEEAQAHREETLASRDRELGHIVEQIQSHMVSLQSSAQTSTERQKHLEGELKQSHDSIQVQLQGMAETRADIDREIEELEERKRNLRMELEEVSRQLEETRVKQRQHMEKCDKQRNEVDTLMATTKDKIAAEDTILKDSEREKSIIERTQQLVRDTDGVVQRALGGQLEELRKKQTQFHDHFQELLREHLGHVDMQLQHLRSRAEDPLARDGAVEAAAAAEGEFRKFKDEYQELLNGAEVKAKVHELEAGHAAVRALLAQSSPASPAAAAAATAVDQEAAASADALATPVPAAPLDAAPAPAVTAAAAPPSALPTATAPAASPTVDEAAASVVAPATPVPAVPVDAAPAPAVAAAPAPPSALPPAAAPAASPTVSAAPLVSPPAVAVAPAAAPAPAADPAPAPAPAPEASPAAAPAAGIAEAAAPVVPVAPAPTAPAELLPTQGSSEFQPPPRAIV